MESGYMKDFPHNKVSYGRIPDMLKNHHTCIVGLPILNGMKMYVYNLQTDRDEKYI